MIHDFTELRPQVLEHYPDGWPWQVVGVFPVEPDGREWFDYTVGLGLVELHCPCFSIEGRGMGNDLCASILNVIAAAWRLGYVAYGDSVTVPLGIPGPDGGWERDADAVFWIAHERVPARTKQVNMTTADWCVPLIWSSPLGWPDE